MACDTDTTNLYYLKRGDTARSIQATLLDPDDVAVNLTTASSVKFIMRLKGARGSATPKVEAAAVIVTAASGIVRYDWVTADVNTVGTYYAEWEVIWPVGKPDTYPSNGYNEVIIQQDLNE
jgi:hypothetical protein